MATRKPPYLRTQFSKENLISSSNPSHTTYHTPKKLPPDTSPIEVQLDRHRIKCRICQISENIPADTKFQTSDENRRAGHSDLRKLIEKFKEKHCHNGN